MNNFSKALTLTLGIVAITATTASALVTYPNGKWDRGNQQGATGWYMAHSYYTNSSETHYAESWLNGKSETGLAKAGPGSVAASNSQSQQSTSFDNLAYTASGWAIEDIGSGTY